MLKSFCYRVSVLFMYHGMHGFPNHILGCSNCTSLLGGLCQLANFFGCKPGFLRKLPAAVQKILQTGLIKYGF